MGCEESQSRFTQNEEPTDEGSLDERILTGNSADWPGMKKNGSSVTLSGALATAGSDEVQDANEAGPDTPTLISWHLEGSATKPVAAAFCTDFPTDI